nr:SDR family oxidoreductase [Nakamurella leprariae]
MLADRVVLVVGGTGLIGTAVVERLREEGAVVVPASRHADPATGGLVMDARDEASVRDGVAGIVAEHGRLDGVVVTAAPSAQTLDPARNADPAQVAEAFDAKALSFLRVAAAAIPAMREAGSGRIVGISGQNAFLTGNITGSVRNAALNLIGKNLADELAGTGITVNTVNPGLVKHEPASEVDAGRPGDSSPAQIADLVTFLVSPRAVLSGESLVVGHRVRGVSGH